jgi:hypothetical protein
VFIELSSSVDVALGIAAAARIPRFGGAVVLAYRRFRRFAVARDW